MTEPDFADEVELAGTGRRRPTATAGPQGEAMLEVEVPADGSEHELSTTVPSLAETEAANYHAAYAGARPIVEPGEDE